MKRPPFPVFPELQNERIRLVELTAGFAETAMELLTYEKKKAQTIDDALSIIGHITEDYQNGDSINWLIIDSSTQQVAGTCGFNRGFKNDQGEIGYILLDSFKGKGYMSATLKLVIRFGLEEMKLKKIFAHTKESNKESRFLLESNSFIEVEALEDNYIEYIYRQV